VNAAKLPMDGSVEGHHRLAFGRSPGGAERSASVRVACEFLPIGTPSANGVRRWIDGREFEQGDECKRIFGKGLGEPRAVSSADTTVRCASRGFVETFVAKL